MNKANAEMKDKKKGHNTKVSTSGGAVVRNLSPWKVLLSHLICGIGLAINVYSINLIDSPAVWLIEIPIVIMIYSLFRKDKAQSSYLKAVARGLLGLPIGAIINALGAIALGAPIGTHYFQRTLNWSLLMSAFTFVPAACVYGSSWVDWQQTFVHTKLIGIIDYMICLPAHGAVIGAWFGAWPMPLDWERTWQEWPICVTYGAIFGYLVGMLGSICFVVFRVLHQHKKGD